MHFSGRRLRFASSVSSLTRDRDSCILCEAGCVCAGEKSGGHAGDFGVDLVGLRASMLGS